MTALVIMFFCMYFFETKFFQYGWKSASKQSFTDVLNNPANFEINTNGVAVEIKSSFENKIIYTDGYVGIVKGIKHDDGSIEIPASTVKITDTENKTTISVTEPSKGIFSAGKSKLEIYINENFLKENIPNITINSVKGSNLVNLGEYASNIEFNSSNKAYLNAASKVNKLTGSYEIGKVTCAVDVANIDIATKNGTLQVKGAVIGSDSLKADVTVNAENANINLKEILGTFTYTGKNAKPASGGKINITSIAEGITIDAKSFDLNINELTGGCNINASTTGNVNIKKFVASLVNKTIIVNKGKVNINHLDVDSINIETTNGNININATSTTNQNNTNKIIAKSTNGDIKINAKITSNEQSYFYAGEIKATSTKGSIILKDVNCKVNLKSTDKGKVVCYFETIFNESSLETNEGDLFADVRPGSAAFLNVVANNKSINLPNTTTFAEKTKLTPIYNAQNIEENPILTLISNSGKVEIKQY